jgi:hypothetical protein
MFNNEYTKDKDDNNDDDNISQIQDKKNSMG